MVVLYPKKYVPVVVAYKQMAYYGMWSVQAAAKLTQILVAGVL